MGIFKKKLWKDLSDPPPTHALSSSLFEASSYHAGLAGLELSVLTRMSSNSLANYVILIDILSASI